MKIVISIENYTETPSLEVGKKGVAGFWNCRSIRIFLIIFSVFALNFSSFSQDTLSYEVKAKIFEQLISNLNITPDSTCQNFSLNHFHEDMRLLDEMFFSDYLSKKQLSKINSSFVTNKTESLDINFSKKELMVFSTHVEYDSNTGETIWLSTSNVWHYRIDDNHKVYYFSTEKYSTQESESILEQILSISNGKFNKNICEIRAVGINTDSFLHESFFQNFLKNNGDSSLGLCLNLELLISSEFQIVETMVYSIHENLETGEIEYDYFIDNQFFFKISNYSQVIQISKEEFQSYYKLSMPEIR